MTTPDTILADTIAAQVIASADTADGQAVGALASDLINTCARRAQADSPKAVVDAINHLADAVKTASPEKIAVARVALAKAAR